MYLEEQDMQGSKIIIGTILASLIFVAISAFPIPSGYAQSIDQSNIIVAPTGDVFGFVDIKSDGHSLDIKGLSNYLPPSGNVFEAWLLDGGSGASGYPLSIGEFTDNLTLSYDANLVNPFTYTDLFVTIEPQDDPDPKPATSVTVGLAPLSVPFGK